MRVTKGDIVYLQKGAYQKNIGNIQGGMRPLLVVSNDTGNHFSNIALVVPLTGNLKKCGLPTHTMICGVDKLSMALCEQIFTINQNDVCRIAKHATQKEIENVEKALKNSLGIG